MRKICATIISLLTLSAIVLPTAADAFAVKNATARAQTAQEQTTENGLVAPPSYKEYLQLKEPACVAVCENYTAIADGNDIYLYDGADNEYRKYTHTVNAELSQNNINQMQFDSEENLYFLDGSFLFLMETDKFDEFSTATATATGFPCDNFLIDGQYIYYVEAKTPAVISKTELKTPNVSTAKKITDVGGKPDLAMFNGELYFVDASAQVILYKVNPQTPDTLAQVAVLDGRIEHMTVADGVFAYTTPTGELFVYSLSDATERGLQYSALDGGYSRLTAYGPHIYVTQKQKGIVKEYSVENKAFTDFEISSDSPAEHRLNKATDIALCGNGLFIIDDGNQRVSVYDQTNGTLQESFPIATSATYIATDGKTVITASQTEATVYATTGEPLASFNAFNGNITGVAAVYGTHYIVTESNYFYAVTTNEENLWQITEVQKTSTHPPQLLTADAYGNLYIKSGSYAYTFTETSFMQADGNGVKLLDSLPTDAVKIAVDYDGNLYALAGGVYKYEKQTDGGYTQTAIDVSERFVYGDAPTFTSLAFGIEKNATYLLCNGNYIVRTANLDLPTVTNIPVDNADESIFAETEASFEIVKTAPKTLLVAFDVETLKSADVFPYLSYHRSETEKTALKIGEDTSGKYNLIAHFDTQTSKYSTYLVLKSACETLPADDYRIEYAESEQKSAWLTNSLSLYKFPYLCENLVVTQTLPRGAEVTLLGEIGELDHAYYRIAYTDENGALKTGYIPQSYATLFDASPKESTTTLVGDKESNRDAVWRLAYILLGFGAICILVDFLILRKKKDD